MATINDTPMWVEGSLSAGNILSNKISISVAGSSSSYTGSVTVTTSGMNGTGRVYPQVTAHDNTPAGRGTGYDTDVRMVSVSFPASPPTPDGSQFTIWVHRATSTATTVFYFVTRNP